MQYHANNPHADITVSGRVDLDPAEQVDYKTSDRGVTRRIEGFTYRGHIDPTVGDRSTVRLQAYGHNVLKDGSLGAEFSGDGYPGHFVTTEQEQKFLEVRAQIQSGVRSQLAAAVEHTVGRV
jgi:hypothetical protein